MKTINKVIVIGGNHHNTLSVLRSLGFQSIRSTLILVTKEKRPYVKFSKFIEKAFIIESEAQISEILKTIASETHFGKYIVIACSDAVSSQLDLIRNQFNEKFVFPGTEQQGRVTMLMNKESMVSLAQVCGLNTPPSTVIDAKTPSKSIACNIIYPCIVKPLISKDGTKQDIHIYKSFDDFIHGFSLLHHSCEKLQIQTYIDKELEFQLIGCSLNGGETIIIPGVSIIIRQPENTNTGFLKYLPRDSFSFNEDSCKRFIKSTGYSGLFSMEFIRGKDRKDYFMEINFRNDGNAICVTASGMNLPYIWVLHNSGMSINDYISSCTMKKVYVMPEFNDFSNVLKGNISLFKWIKDVYKTDCFMEFCKSDQSPFWMYILNRFLKLCRLVQ